VKLEESGAVIEHHERRYLANPAAYDRKLGLLTEALGIGVELLIQ
jgi:hypothetical protein